MAVIACSAFTDGKPAAEEAIERFHTMLNQERYEDMYAAVDPSFKEATTQAEFMEFLQAVHIKLGKVTSSTNTNWRANSYLTGTQSYMQQETAFENGKAVEDFTFMFADKKVTLVGYNINSRELITR
jgi:hypothetical protein